MSGKDASSSKQAALEPAPLNLPKLSKLQASLLPCPPALKKVLDSFFHIIDLCFFGKKNAPTCQFFFLLSCGAFLVDTVFCESRKERVVGQKRSFVGKETGNPGSVIGNRAVFSCNVYLGRQDKGWLNAPGEGGRKGVLAEYGEIFTTGQGKKISLFCLAIHLIWFIKNVDFVGHIHYACLSKYFPP